MQRRGDAELAARRPDRRPRPPPDTSEPVPDGGRHRHEPDPRLGDGDVAGEQARERHSPASRPPARPWPGRAPSRRRSRRARRAAGRRIRCDQRVDERRRSARRAASRRRRGRRAAAATAGELGHRRARRRPWPPSRPARPGPRAAPRSRPRRTGSAPADGTRTARSRPASLSDRARVPVARSRSGHEYADRSADPPTTGPTRPRLCLDGRPAALAAPAGLGRRRRVRRVRAARARHSRPTRSSRSCRRARRRCARTRSRCTCSASRSPPRSRSSSATRTACLPQPRRGSCRRPPALDRAALGPTRAPARVIALPVVNAPGSCPARARPGRPRSPTSPCPRLDGRSQSSVAATGPTSPGARRRRAPPGSSRPRCTRARSSTTRCR